MWNGSPADISSMHEIDNDNCHEAIFVVIGDTRVYHFKLEFWQLVGFSVCKLVE